MCTTCTLLYLLSHPLTSHWRINPLTYAADFHHYYWNPAKSIAEHVLIFVSRRMEKSRHFLSDTIIGSSPPPPWNPHKRRERRNKCWTFEFSTPLCTFRIPFSYLCMCVFEVGFWCWREEGWVTACCERNRSIRKGTLLLLLLLCCSSYLPS